MPEKASGKGRVLVESLHLFVLWGLAVAQPIYDLLARHSGFFVVRRSEPVDVLILTGALSFLLPAAVVGVVAILRMAPPEGGKRNIVPEGAKCNFVPEGGKRITVRSLGTLCHRTVVAILVAMLALQILKRLAEDPLSGWTAIGIATGVGLGSAAAYHRFPAARQFLTFLTPAIVIFPAVFLFDPSVSKIVRPRHIGAIEELKVQPSTLASSMDTPVFLIVFDALPATSLMNGAREIDAVRFPNFARLATGATWYRNTTTVSADTIWAVPAILTGNYPDLSRQPSYHDHPRNLFTLLGKSHELVLFEHLTDLCPRELCPREVSSPIQRLGDLVSDLQVVFLHVLLPADLTASLPQISQAWGDFTVADTKLGQRNRNRKFRLFLNSIDPQRSRPLYFLHSLFPHAPYQYLPSGKRYTRVRQDVGRQAVLRGRWHDDEQSVLEQHRRHLLQVGMVDTLLGHILERLEQTDLFDRSLIVVTSDHGVSFRPGDYRRRLSRTNFPDVMPVPLLIKQPGQSVGKIDDRNVETIDILPTIVDVLGLELPWPVDGVSAADATRPERPTKICYGEVASRTGMLELPVAAFDAALDAIERKEQIFGDEDFTAVLRAGPYPELVGRPLDSLMLDANRAGPLVKFAKPSLFRKVDPASDFIPALVEGFIGPSPGFESPLDLAIAINGSVAATTRTRLEPLGHGLLTRDHRAHRRRLPLFRVQAAVRRDSRLWLGPCARLSRGHPGQQRRCCFTESCAQGHALHSRCATCRSTFPCSFCRTSRASWSVASTIRGGRHRQGTAPRWCNAVANSHGPQAITVMTVGELLWRRATTACAVAAYQTHASFSAGPCSSNLGDGRRAGGHGVLEIRSSATSSPAKKGTEWSDDEEATFKQPKSID